jgi:protein-disulfide isomerase
MEGNPSGTVWIAEFADFQCPHCAHIQADMAQVMADRPQVRVYFKFFPLPGHPMGRPAAHAAWAANLQGKFWPYAHQLFQTTLDQPDGLSPPLMDAFAGQLGLDLTKFKADEDAPTTDQRVQRDLDEGMQLQIQATPTLFINGHRLEGYAAAPEIESWVDELSQ